MGSTTIDEGYLNLVAGQLADRHVEDGDALNDLVKEKVAEDKLNTEQTKRLIEKTNGEAFIKLFPAKTSFEVADPEAVLGIKVASEGLAPAPKSSYKQSLAREFDDIFGLENVKVASEVAEYKGTTSLKGWRTKIAKEAADDEFRVQVNSVLLAKEASYDSAYRQFKNELLGGRSVAELETELYQGYPEKFAAIAELVDSFIIRIGFIPDAGLLKRATVEEFDADGVVTSSKLLDAFEGILSYAD